MIFQYIYFFKLIFMKTRKYLKSVNQISTEVRKHLNDFLFRKNEEINAITSQFFYYAILFVKTFIKENIIILINIDIYTEFYNWIRVDSRYFLAL